MKCQTLNFKAFLKDYDFEINRLWRYFHGIYNLKEYEMYPKRNFGLLS
jgi:hypothetical protein